MNTILSDFWPALTIIVPIVVLYFGYIQQLRIRVAVLEETTRNQQILIEKMQQRMDSHSKKQDEILSAISSLKVDIVKELGAVTNEQSIMAADIKSINRTLSIIDKG